MTGSKANTIQISLDDIDELELMAKHEGWDLRCLQLSAGKQTWQYSAVELPEMYLALEHHGPSSTVLAGTPPKGLLPILMPLMIERSFGYRGREVTEAESIIVQEDEADFAIDGELRCLVVYLTEEAFREVRRAVFGPDGAWIAPDGEASVVNGLAMAELKNRIGELFLSDLNAPDAGVNFENLPAYITSQLALALYEHDRRTDRRTGGFGDSTSVYARRAQDFMEENRDRALSLPEMCSMVGVSLRTMNYAFQHYYGVPPAKYHTLRRLDGARRELNYAHPAATTVTEVATKWGFWHFGRFAQAYRKQFGELPSQSLARRPARVSVRALNSAHTLELKMSPRMRMGSMSPAFAP